MMRFGRRNKSRLIPMRTDVSEPLPDSLGPVASDERNALLAGSIAHESVDVPDDPPLPPSLGDPTQRLVTALGRFHRYVAKGQAGASQEYWSDDCMEQLGMAIEIALSQNWMNIVEALTDVARILHSYENVGMARHCVPFLNESYEILSLMAGDLIVNNVRSGVMDKWRERYRRAVADLSAAGLTLVQDEEDEPEPSPQGRVIPFESAPPTADSSESPKAPPASDSFLPFLDISPEEAAEEPMDQPPLPNFPPDEMPAAEPAAKAGPAEAITLVEEQTPESEPESDTSGIDRTEPEPAHEDPPCKKSLKDDPEASSLLDALSNELTRLDKMLAAGSAIRLDVVCRLAAALEQRAGEQGFEVSQSLCRLMTALCTRTQEHPGAGYEHFLDMAYAFCEAYVEASRNVESVAVTTWRADVEDMLKPSSMEAPASPDISGPSEGAPESLLETAQLAVARGDMSGAKVLALQAVAQLARTEASKAEARVQDAEQKLRQASEAIDRARSLVKKAEQDVTVAENRVSGGEAELAELRNHTIQYAEQVNGIERRIAEIDEQIRALQAARTVEESRFAEASAELEAARDAESRGNAELRALQEAEDAARERLEDARQQVKDQQRKRQECEAALMRSRETLTKHRASLADIERTVAQLGEDETRGGAESDGMLF